MDYLAIKQAHILLAIVSVAGFALRFRWLVTDNALLQKRVSKVLPHVIDTIFFATGVALVLIADIYPHQQRWFSHKLALVLVYIFCGVQLFRATERAHRWLWFSGALICVGGITALALLKPVFD